MNENYGKKDKGVEIAELSILCNLNVWPIVANIAFVACPEFTTVPRPKPKHSLW